MSNDLTVAAINHRLVIAIKDKMRELDTMITDLLIIKEEAVQNTELNFIVNSLARHYFVTLSMLSGGSREQRLVCARQLFCWYLRTNTLMTLQAIGNLIHRDHTTVMHSVQTFKERLEFNDPMTVEMHNTIFLNPNNTTTDEN